METKPAEGRSPVSVPLLTIGAVATPAAWLLQICAGETLIAHACFPHDMPLHMPLASSVGWGVVGMSALLFIVGLCGTGLALRNWRRLKRSERRQTPESEDPKVDGEAFVARMGLMASGLFLFALVATDVATGLVSACT